MMTLDDPLSKTEPDVDDEGDEGDDPGDEAEYESGSGNHLALPVDQKLILKRISSGELSTFSFNQNGSLVAILDSRISQEFLDIDPQPSTPVGKSLPPPPASSEGLEIITVNGKAVVSLGSVEALVGVFMGADELSMDPNYLHDFLSTYRFFLSPPDLLSTVIRFYGALEVIRQKDKTQEEVKAFGQRRLLNFLRKWFERFTQDFIRNPGLELRLRDFLTSSLCKVERHSKFVESFYTVIEDTLGRLETSNSLEDLPSRKGTLSPTDFVAPTAELLARLGEVEAQGDGVGASDTSPPTQVAFDDSNIKAIAEQLTAIELGLFKAIEELEFSDNLKSPQDYSTPHLSWLLTWSEGMMEWVARQVCAVKDQKLRVGVIMYFIILATKCRELGNYNALFEIVSGLLLPPVVRLTKTWKHVVAIPKTKALWAVSPPLSLSLSFFASF